MLGCYHPPPQLVCSTGTTGGLAMGDVVLVEVVSWSNIMCLHYYVNMAGLCSQSHVLP